MSNTLDRKLGVKAPESLIKQVDEEAEKNNINRSAYVRMILSNEVKE